jgi:DNA topoisomerase-3
MHLGKTTLKAAARKRERGSGKSATRAVGKVNADAPLADGPGRDTPLRIPFGNKDVALQLGARYRSGGWYAPPGIDLAGFRRRGWL